MDDDTSRSEDLEAAWPEEETEETTQEVESEESDESVDTATEPTAELGEESAVASEPETVPEDTVSHEEVPEQGDVSSPVSWSATAREQWKDIPKEAQEYILQREQQMQQGMQKNAEQAQRAEAMDQTLAPYQQYFAMNGGPGQTLQTLLQTGAGLQMGTPQQKAQLVANVIQQYGVDIPSLDALLTGKDVPESVQQQTQMEQMLQQQLAPLQQQLAQYQQREQQVQQGVQQKAGGEVQEFASNPANEFYADVRGDMADILDMAHNRGVQLTLQQAYERACALNPEISRIQQSREQQKTLQSKRKAAASVTGGMGGPGASAAPDSMRSAIENAWENSGQM